MSGHLWRMSLVASLLEASLLGACSEARHPPGSVAAIHRDAKSTRTPAPQTLPLAVDAEPRVLQQTDTATSTVPAADTFPSRVAVTGSTRGVIACGDRFCTAQQQICVSGASPTDAPFACLQGGAPVDDSLASTYACDDGTDCPRGETCCRLPSSVAEAYACVPRREVASRCGWEVCAEGGAACPQGLTCIDGACSKNVLAECGQAGTRCPAERPLCSYSPEESKCVTVDEGETAQAQWSSSADDVHGGLYSCARDSDCGGDRKCCAADGGRRTFCALGCDTGNGMRVCSSIADCQEIRNLCAGDATCLKAVRCAPQATAASWIKMCTTTDE